MVAQNLYLKQKNKLICRVNRAILQQNKYYCNNTIKK